MRVIGLTGSIACGKSSVSRELKALGYPVIDGDQLSRELTVPGSPVLSQIASVFGQEYLREDGSLNRSALGALIFRDAEARKKLDDLMAAPLEELVNQRLSEVRSRNAVLCFLEMPLLFEKGYQKYCDTVWCVWLSPEDQLSRLMRRDGYSEEEALSRIRSVMSSDEKAALSDVVIDNSAPLAETLAALPGLLDAEKSKTSPQRRRSDRYLSAVPSNQPQPDPGPVSEHPDRGNASLLPEGPVSLERPDAARKKRSSRKVSWMLPAWLLITLISVSSLLLVSFTAQCLMGAYLVRRAEEHEAERRAVDAAYPLLYEDLIAKHADTYNLQPAFVAAIIFNESSFRPEVESDAGARGLMQLMPDTAEWIAHKLKTEQYSFERMLDPGSNIQFGCWYLNYLSKLFRGDPICVACAYHAGQGEITSWLSDPAISEDGKTLQLDRLPQGPTRQYAERVTHDYGIYQEKYFSSSVADPDDSAALDSL